MTYADSGEIPPGIEIVDLVQGYGKRNVLQDLSITIPDRSIVGLLGPNGAGKTTLMRTIATLMPPRSGSVSVLGYDVTARQDRTWLRQNLGYLPQNFTADDKLTVKEYVSYALWMREFPKAEIDGSAAESIERAGLANHAGTELRELSGGMRQRAGIAAATAGTPPLLILDEPTSGLDPEQRSQYREVLRSLDSRMILISTHLIEDVASVADHLVVVSDGEVPYAGSAEILRGEDRSIDALERIYVELMKPGQ